MIDSWIEKLGSDDLIERLTAENAVIVAGDSAVEGLTQVLTSTNDERRWRAATALGDIGAKHALEFLYPLIADPLWDARAGTAYALGMIGDARSFEALSGVAFGDVPDEQTPYVAALGLLRLHRQHAIDLLNEALRHETEQVRRMAMSALAVDRYRI